MQVKITWSGNYLDENRQVLLSLILLVENMSQNTVSIVFFGELNSVVI